MHSKTFSTNGQGSTSEANGGTMHLKSYCIISIKTRPHEAVIFGTIYIKQWIYLKLMSIYRSVFRLLYVCDVHGK